MGDKATEQASPRPGRGGVIPPAERQFGQPGGNPRHNGAWKKEQTPRYKLEKMMSLNTEELELVEADTQAPVFERKLAKFILRGDWKTIESMMTQVYGQPKQVVGFSGNPVQELLDKFGVEGKNGQDKKT